jgi:hypothetical protein
MNGSLQQFIISEIEDRVNRILFRRNFGRNFAAYREASLFLYEQGIHSLKVIYANDSVVYFNTPELDSLVDVLIESRADYVGVTDSFEET